MAKPSYLYDPANAIDPQELRVLEKDRIPI